MSKTVTKDGFSLLEIFLAIFLVSILGFLFYSMIDNATKILIINNLRVKLFRLLENEMEYIKNLSYDQIGIKEGHPPGILPREKIIQLDNLNFKIVYTVRNIDDPFDGTITDTPPDRSPADYKFIETEISCLNCSFKIKPVSLSYIIAPKDIESSSNNGHIFVRVFNAYGEPVEGARVLVKRNNPSITIEDTTDVNGFLSIIDIATGTEAYEITVTKDDYTEDKTYPRTENNPNPLKPHVTVSERELTTVSFEIDRKSSLLVKSIDIFCNPRPNFNFSLQGTKLIGTNPDVLKFSQNFETDNNGQILIDNLEWDKYSLKTNDENFFLRGSNLLTPLNLIPGTSSQLWLMTENKKPSALLVYLINNREELVNEASVSLRNNSYQKTLISGRETIFQTDWSTNNYSDKSQFLETNLYSGEIRLTLAEEGYPTSSPQWLISKTFDLGNDKTKFYNLSFESEKPEGTDIYFQLATNNDNQTWNFVGPDGTSNSFYTLENQAINPLHNNSRYLRYKVYLKTEDSSQTPKLKEISIDFSSPCIPPGQAYFDNLNLSSYTLQITKDNFSTTTDINVSNYWQEIKIKLE